MEQLLTTEDIVVMAIAHNYVHLLILWVIFDCVFAIRLQLER